MMKYGCYLKKKKNVFQLKNVKGRARVHSGQGTGNILLKTSLWKIHNFDVMI